MTTGEETTVAAKKEAMVEAVMIMGEEITTVDKKAAMVEVMATIAARKEATAVAVMITDEEITIAAKKAAMVEVVETTAARKEATAAAVEVVLMSMVNRKDMASNRIMVVKRAPIRTASSAMARDTDRDIRTTTSPVQQSMPTSTPATVVIRACSARS